MYHLFTVGNFKRNPTSSVQNLSTTENTTVSRAKTMKKVSKREDSRTKNNLNPDPNAPKTKRRKVKKPGGKKRTKRLKSGIIVGTKDEIEIAPMPKLPRKSRWEDPDPNELENENKSADDEEVKDSDLKIRDLLASKDDIIEHMFQVITAADLQEMTPDLLKKCSIEELKKLCLVELQNMTTEQILHTISDFDPYSSPIEKTMDEEDPTSKTDENVEKVEENLTKNETYQAIDIFRKSESEASSVHSPDVQVLEEEEENTGSFEVQDEVARELNLTECDSELLELEMRARAIRALLSSKCSARNVESPQKDLDGEPMIEEHKDTIVEDVPKVDSELCESDKKLGNEDQLLEGEKLLIQEIEAKQKKLVEIVCELEKEDAKSNEKKKNYHSAEKEIKKKKIQQKLRRFKILKREKKKKDKEETKISQNDESVASQNEVKVVEAKIITALKEHLKNKMESETQKAEESLENPLLVFYNTEGKNLQTEEESSTCNMGIEYLQNTEGRCLNISEGLFISNTDEAQPVHSPSKEIGHSKMYPQYSEEQVECSAAPVIPSIIKSSIMYSDHPEIAYPDKENLKSITEENIIAEQLGETHVVKAISTPEPMNLESKIVDKYENNFAETSLEINEAAASGDDKKKENVFNEGSENKIMSDKQEVKDREKSTDKTEKDDNESSEFKQGGETIPKQRDVIVQSEDFLKQDDVDNIQKSNSPSLTEAVHSRMEPDDEEYLIVVDASESQDSNDQLNEEVWLPVPRSFEIVNIQESFDTQYEDEAFERENNDNVSLENSEEPSDEEDIINPQSPEHSDEEDNIDPQSPEHSDEEDIIDPKSSKDSDECQSKYSRNSERSEDFDSDIEEIQAVDSENEKSDGASTIIISSGSENSNEQFPDSETEDYSEKDFLEVHEDEEMEDEDNCLDNVSEVEEIGDESKEASLDSENVDLQDQDVEGDWIELDESDANDNDDCIQIDDNLSDSGDDV